MNNMASAPAIVIPPKGEPVIEVRNLFRSFGNVKAVNDLSFTIRTGQVIGFIGANGAGKTTTLRMLATLELPEHGQINIAGIDAVEDPNAVRPLIGWVPDDFGRYSHLTIAEYMDFFARSFDFKGAERLNRITEVLDFCGLGGLEDRFIDKLSKGQGQRVCLARALLHDPPILLLDEPAAGLDPKARVELKNLIRILAAEGKTIFISSHILSELQEMCDSMLFIDRGSLLHHGDAEDLKRQADESLIMELCVAVDDPQQLRSVCDMLPGVRFHESLRKGCRLILADSSDEALAQTLQRLIQAGLPVTEFKKIERRLEDAFVDILSKGQK